MRPKAAAAVLIALCAASCNRKPAEEASRDRARPEAVLLGPEDIAEVTTGPVITGAVISGELQAQDQATVRAQLGGALIEVNARAGQRVSKGQVLARIRAIAEKEAVGSAQAAVRTAETELEVAQRDQDRTAVLVKAGALAQRDLEQARSAVAAARARVAEAEARLAAAREQLSESVVRAPMAGVISNAPVNGGDVVAVGAEIFTILNPYTLELRASLPAENLSSLRAGTAVLFQVQGYGGREFRGTIRRISPAADAATGQVEVYASIPNDSGLLISGLYAQGRLATGKENTLVIPSAALRSRGQAHYVMKVSGNQALMQDIQAGARDERTGRVEVVAGLRPGEVVLVGPAAGIQPGARVEIRER